MDRDLFNSFLLKMMTDTIPSGAHFVYLGGFEKMVLRNASEREASDYYHALLNSLCVTGTSLGVYSVFAPIIGTYIPFGRSEDTLVAELSTELDVFLF